MDGADAGDLQRTIESAIDGLLLDAPHRPGVVVSVDGPDTRLAVARGVADVETLTPLSSDHAFRIASCTKTFVASVVVDLDARGLLDLDQPAIEVTPPETAADLARHENGRGLTVRHLLHHRSGLVDHTTTAAFQQLQSDSGRTHEWTAHEQLGLAIERPALFAPGAAFSYSDSGYVLLGQIIEHLTDSTLAAAVRTTCRLGEVDVPSIHWERAEAVPARLERAHQYLDGEDTFDWDPTIDLFGGGGLISTMPDLAQWWSALFGGSVHEYLDVLLASPQPAIGPVLEPIVGALTS